MDNFVKNSAYVGGSSLAAILVNRLLGNKSLKSDIIAGAIGAGAGGIASALDNPKLDMSHSIQNTESELKDVEKLTKEAGWGFSLATSPLTALKDVWFGGSGDSDKRDEAISKLEYLRKSKNTKRATPKQRARINNLYKKLKREKALDERQTDAALTLGGGVAGAGLSIPLAAKAQDIATKYMPGKVTDYDKLIKDVVEADPDILKGARGAAIKDYKDAKAAKNRLKETLSFKKGAKRSGFKQTMSDLGSVISMKGRRAKADYDVIKGISIEQQQMRRPLEQNLKEAEKKLSDKRKGLRIDVKNALSAHSAKKRAIAKELKDASDTLDKLKKESDILKGQRDHYVKQIITKDTYKKAKKGKGDYIFDKATNSYVKVGKGKGSHVFVPGKTINKITDQVAYDRYDGMFNAKKGEVNHAHWAVDRLSRKQPSRKLTDKATDAARKWRDRNHGALSKEVGAVNDVKKALNNYKTSTPHAKQSLKALLKAKMSPSKLHSLALKTGKSPLGKTFAGVIAASALGGSLLAGGLSNYPASKAEVDKYD